jgi:NADH:ubiquinone oxidoreductase subunit 3 (subunit A)
MMPVPAGAVPASTAGISSATMPSFRSRHRLLVSAPLQFVGVLLLGWGYAVRKGALTWQ